MMTDQVILPEMQIVATALDAAADGSFGITLSPGYGFMNYEPPAAAYYRTTVAANQQTGVELGAVDRAHAGQQLAAMATIMGEAIDGTIPINDANVFLTARQPLLFVGPDTMMVGKDGQQYAYHTETPAKFNLVTPNAFLVSHEATWADWVTAAAAVATLTFAVSRPGGLDLGNILMGATPFVPAEMAGSLGRVAHDIGVGVAVMQHGVDTGRIPPQVMMGF